MKYVHSLGSCIDEKCCYSSLEWPCYIRWQLWKPIGVVVWIVRNDQICPSATITIRLKRCALESLVAIVCREATLYWSSNEISKLAGIKSLLRHQAASSRSLTINVPIWHASHFTHPIRWEERTSRVNRTVVLRSKLRVAEVWRDCANFPLRKNNVFLTIALEQDGFFFRVLFVRVQWTWFCRGGI